MGGGRPKEGELDRLTGILKKSVAEMRIASFLGRSQGGTLFLCNVDQLKRINEQYGHRVGDECLREAAQILRYMIGSDDIPGRRGGDEFLIFMSRCQDEEQAQAVCRRIEKRFSDRKGVPFSVTVAYALRQPSDTCKSLFCRASEELERCRVARCQSEEQGGKRKDHYRKDVVRIRRELNEQIQNPGAYCQDYETFRGIYRFLERGLVRSGQKACIILITVVDEQGESPLPHEKDMLMEKLGETIGAMLRIGDVYTRYSSSQYLLLAIDTAEGQTDVIVDRIRERFMEDSRGNNLLIHHCYELRPARVEEFRN